ncbi:MAG: Nif11-like leader peptide family natural product precursor [Synechococcaceae bacterium WB8_1B_136]|nr:Nif11-like leader peptide family natural product precursor [Synechococcaceae bacterium WB8_1B_136]
MTLEQLRHFLSRVQRDTALKQQVQEAITADEVARLAQDLGFSVSGSDILRFSGLIPISAP